MAAFNTKMYDNASIAEISTITGSPFELSSPIRRRATLHIGAFLAAVCDLVTLFASALLALTLRFPLSKILHETMARNDAIGMHFAFLVLYAGLIVMLCNSQRLYSRFQMYSAGREVLAVTHAVCMASLLLTGAIYVSGTKILSRVVIVTTMLLTLLGMIAWRSGRRRLNSRSTADGVTSHNVVIIGTDFLAEALHNYINQHSEFGLVVAGLLTTTNDEASLSVPGILGTLADLPRICQAKFIDEVIVCAQNRETVKAVLDHARNTGIGVRIVPDLYDGIALGAPIDYLGTFPTIALHQKYIPAVALTLKRLLDLVISLCGLFVLSPVLIAVAIAVKLDSPGPVLYSSPRVGKKGHVFNCLKFRTMVANADQLREKLKHLNERDSILFKISRDPRITRAGQFLRKYSFDELPQLWNVLKGEMSIVGPRPPLANEVERYELEYLRRLEVAPGITGLWQVEARSHPSFERYIALDLQYVEEWSILMDLKILFRTIGVVFAGTGS